MSWYQQKSRIKSNFVYILPIRFITFQLIEHLNTSRKVSKFSISCDSHLVSGDVNVNNSRSQFQYKFYRGKRYGACLASLNSLKSLQIKHLPSKRSFVWIICWFLRDCSVLLLLSTNKQWKFYFHKEHLLELINGNFGLLASTKLHQVIYLKFILISTEI